MASYALSVQSKYPGKWAIKMNSHIQIFQNRKDAGKQLAKQLFEYAEEAPVILALPRGGVPIGYEIASLLHVPLDIIAVRKITVPNRPEFGIGAVAEGNVELFDKRTLREFGITRNDLSPIIRYKTEELKRRVMAYRGTTEPLSVKNRTVILVDDGLATGVTARAAVLAVKKLKPKKIIFVSPVCAYDTAVQMQSKVDDVICLATPPEFMSVSIWYRQFDQITDEEVMKLLQKNRKESHGVFPHHLE